MREVEDRHCQKLGLYFSAWSIAQLKVVSAQIIYFLNRGRMNPRIYLFGEINQRQKDNVKTTNQLC